MLIQVHRHVVRCTVNVQLMPVATHALLGQPMSSRLSVVVRTLYTRKAMLRARTEAPLGLQVAYASFQRVMLLCGMLLTGL